MKSNAIFYKAINLFFQCCITYINDLSNKTEKDFYNEKIEAIVFDYLVENNCDISIQNTIFPIIHMQSSAKKPIYQKLFDFVYKSLVYNNNKNKKDNSNNLNSNNLMCSVEAYTTSLANSEFIKSPSLTIFSLLK